MKKALALIVLLGAILGAAYWYMTTADTPTDTRPISEETPEPAQTPGLTVKGPLAIAQGPAGAYLADKNGRTLYIDIRDESPTGKITPHCDVNCEKIWPPYLLGANETAPSQSSDALLSKLNLYKRADGRYQFTLGTAPLYYYASDKNQGDMLGSGIPNWKVATP